MGATEGSPGWIAIADRSRAAVSIAGFDAQGAGFAAQEPLLGCGTLLLETEAVPEPAPRRILDLGYEAPFPGALRLDLLPGGVVALTQVQGENRLTDHLEIDLPWREACLRVSYRWDAPARRGELTAEMPDRGMAFTCTVAAPFPHPSAELAGAFCPARRSLGAQAEFAALARGVAAEDALSLRPRALWSGLPVETPDGPRLLGQLREGDAVRVPSGKARAVLAVRRVTVPARGRFAPVRLRAPYFSLVRDILVAPDYPVTLSGSEVEYLFGEERVVAAARHLVDGIAAVAEPGLSTVTYHELDVAGAAPICAAGWIFETAPDVPAHPGHAIGAADALALATLRRAA